MTWNKIEKENNSPIIHHWSMFKYRHWNHKLNDAVLTDADISAMATLWQCRLKVQSSHAVMQSYGYKGKRHTAIRTLEPDIAATLAGWAFADHTVCHSKTGNNAGI